MTTPTAAAPSAKATESTPIVTGGDYVESLRGRGLTVYLFGETSRSRSIIR